MVSPMVLRMDIRTDHRHFRIQKERRKRNAQKVEVETKNLEVFREQSRGPAGPPLLPVRIPYFKFLFFKIVEIQRPHGTLDHQNFNLSPPGGQKKLGKNPFFRILVIYLASN